MRIFTGTIVAMAIVFLIMITWYIAQPATMAFVLALDPLQAAEAANAVTMIKFAVNNWAAIGVVLTLGTWGVWFIAKYMAKGEVVFK